MGFLQPASAPRERKWSRAGPGGALLLLLQFISEQPKIKHILFLPASMGQHPYPQPSPALPSEPPGLSKWAFPESEVAFTPFSQHRKFNPFDFPCMRCLPG